MLTYIPWELSYRWEFLFDFVLMWNVYDTEIRSIWICYRSSRDCWQHLFYSDLPSIVASIRASILNCSLLMFASYEVDVVPFELSENTENPANICSKKRQIRNIESHWTSLEHTLSRSSPRDGSVMDGCCWPLIFNVSSVFSRNDSAMIVQIDWLI